MHAVPAHPINPLRIHCPFRDACRKESLASLSRISAGTLKGYSGIPPRSRSAGTVVCNLRLKLLSQMVVEGVHQVFTCRKVVLNSALGDTGNIGDHTDGKRASA